MATYNTVIRKRNATNNGWDSILPITTAENVLTDEQGGTVASHLADAMPHKMIDSATEKIYRYGIAIQNGKLGILYEEVL